MLDEDAARDCGSAASVVRKRKEGSEKHLLPIDTQGGEHFHGQRFIPVIRAQIIHGSYLRERRAGSLAQFSIHQKGEQQPTIARVVEHLGAISAPAAPDMFHQMLPHSRLGLAHQFPQLDGEIR